MTEISLTLSWVDAAISQLNKGIGLVDSAVAGGDVAGLDWNLLREDLSLPCAVLYKDRLLHNLDWMRRFIASAEKSRCFLDEIRPGILGFAGN